MLEHAWYGLLFCTPFGIRICFCGQFGTFLVLGVYFGTSYPRLPGTICFVLFLYLMPGNKCKGRSNRGFFRPRLPDFLWGVFSLFFSSRFSWGGGGSEYVNASAPDIFPSVKFPNKKKVFFPGFLEQKKRKIWKKSS